VAQSDVEEVLVERGKKRRRELDQPEHETELGESEPLSADVSRSDEAAACADGNDQL
jgi:hypothetical protein